MRARPVITKVEVHESGYEAHELGIDYDGFDAAYETGVCRRVVSCALQKETDLVVTG